MTAGERDRPRSQRAPSRGTSFIDAGDAIGEAPIAAGEAPALPNQMAFCRAALIRRGSFP
jgi:hypothetical protein